MSDIPPSTSADMRRAADLLESFSEMYDAHYSAHYPWTASRLRHEADVLDAEPMTMSENANQEVGNT